MSQISYHKVKVTVFNSFALVQCITRLVDLLVITYEREMSIEHYAFAHAVGIRHTYFY